MTIRVKQNQRSKERLLRQQNEALKTAEKLDNNEIQNPQLESSPLSIPENEDASASDGVDFVKASNFTGRGSAIVDTIVLHHTGMDMRASIGWLSKGSPRSSTHFIIGRSGQVTQLVDHIDDYSWHTNNEGINRISVGIHLEAFLQGQGLTNEQQDSLADLIRSLMEDLKTIRYLFRHTDLFPTTSQCGVFAFKYRQDLERFIISNGLKVKYPVQRNL